MVGFNIMVMKKRFENLMCCFSIQQLAVRFISRYSIDWLADESFREAEYLGFCDDLFILLLEGGFYVWHSRQPIS